MLAPASLGLFAVVLLIVIAASVGGGSDSGDRDGDGASPGTRNAQPATERRGAESSADRRVYRVRSGDTLAGIADRTEVSLARLLELNPSIDPQGLVTGQRIRLRE